MAHWWCPACKSEILSENVTYNEHHDTCGTSVVWIDAEELSEVEFLKKCITDLQQENTDLRRRLEAAQDWINKAYVATEKIEQERDDLRRQVEELGQKFTDSHTDMVEGALKSTQENYKKIEQQAAAYREALEQIEVLRSYEMDEACMIATKALYPKTPAPADNSYFDRVERQL